MGLFNGMIGEATKDANCVDYQEIELNFDNHKKLKVWEGDFTHESERPVGALKKLNRFDYAYAITCHKSQGSEFDNLLVYNQPVGRTSEDRSRWLYTAITRAKNKLTLVQP